MYVHSSSSTPAAAAIARYGDLRRRPYHSGYRGRAFVVPVMVTARARGIGATTGSKLTGGLIAGGTTGTLTAMSTGSAIAGAAAGGLMAVAPFTGPAAPFLVAAAALIGPIVSMFHGCGATCTQATQIANQASAALEQLQREYMALPVHWRSAQVATLSYMDQVFAQLAQACGNPALGAAGQRCISERLVKGGTAPWCPTPDHTGCDWITALRDPVANDPNVVPDPEPAAGESVLSAFGVNPETNIGGVPLSDLLLPAGLILAALLL